MDSWRKLCFYGIFFKESQGDWEVEVDMRGTYTSINHYCSHSTLLFTSYGTRSDFTENQLDRVRAPKRDCFTSPNRKKVMVFQCKHGYSFLHLWTETVRGLNQGPKLLTAKAQHDPTVRGIEWWNMQAILQQLHSAWSTKTVIIGLKKHEAKLFFFLVRVCSSLDTHIFPFTKVEECIRLTLTCSIV